MAIEIEIQHIELRKGHAVVNCSTVTPNDGPQYPLNIPMETAEAVALEAGGKYSLTLKAIAAKPDASNKAG